MWVLGFFAGGAPNLNFGSYTPDGDLFRERKIPVDQTVRELANWVSSHLGLIIFFAGLLFLVGLIFFFLSVLFQGSLIGAAAKLDAEEEMSFSEAFKIGLANVWRLFGFFLLFVGIALVFVVILGFMVLSIVGLGMSTGSGLMLIFLLMPLALVLIPLGIALGLISSLGMQSIVLEGARPVAAFRRGWLLLREHIGPVLGAWLINIGVAIAFSLALGLIVIMLLVPVGFAALFMFTGGFSMLKLGAIVFFSMLALVVIIIAGGFIGAFRSTFWTLTFRRLVALGAPGSSIQRVR